MEKHIKYYSVTKILDFHFGNPFKKLIEEGHITQEQLDFGGLKGSVVHKANELYLNSKQEDKEKLKWQIGTKFINYLKDIEEKKREKIINLINNSLEHLKDKNGGLTELKVNYDLIRGVIDWIDEDGNIHEFKTSSGSITKDALERFKMQLVAYYWLATKNEYKVSRTAFIDHIKDNNVKVIKVDITDELIDKWQDMVETFIQFQELQQGV